MYAYNAQFNPNIKVIWTKSALFEISWDFVKIKMFYFTPFTEILCGTNSSGISRPHHKIFGFTWFEAGVSRCAQTKAT